MNGYGSHTFKMVNDEGEAVYCKFHYKSDQGIKTFTRQEADKMAMTDPDYAIRDLYNAIVDNDFPTWTMFIQVSLLHSELVVCNLSKLFQVMTFQQAESWYFNPFDLTKV